MILQVGGKHLYAFTIIKLISSICIIVVRGHFIGCWRTQCSAATTSLDPHACRCCCAWIFNHGRCDAVAVVVLFYLFAFPLLGWWWPLYGICIAMTSAAHVLASASTNNGVGAAVKKKKYYSSVRCSQLCQLLANDIRLRVCTSWPCVRTFHGCICIEIIHVQSLWLWTIERRWQQLGRVNRRVRNA